VAIHLVYFKSRDGTISLPPTDDTPCPPGYMRCEANTLDEVDKLQKRLQQATYERCQRELQRDEEAFAESRERVRANLTARIASSATTEYERDFLKLYIQLREDKRDKYRSRFTCDRAYLLARENDEKTSANSMIEKLDL
jgi:hypothetical protein